MCKRLIRIVLASAALAAVSVPSARAAYLVTIEQEGDNVVANGAGSLDLTDLSRSPVTSDSSSFVDGALGAALTGGSDFLYAYYGATGPASFGTDTLTRADSGAGFITGVTTNGSSSFVVIYVEEGYTSGRVFAGSATYDNQTLASLGLTPGIYSYTWGTGAHADSLTIQIGSLSAAPAPEASTWVMMLAGFGGLGAAAVLRQRRARPSPV